jgi:chromosome segregation protein
MYLKRIELAGFKSFADKTELEFVQGITAVVGPNGSGKSNISDGIRWVLGEQSAKSLRGGKMEDIIFAGSDARKAVNYGEVSLTLDNSEQRLPLDFSEVTVTRRVHRSGESEYYINKQACRLRDIIELFMDTGIGKEAYSIIGQGRIEEILSTRSEDRRMLFEEASGIVKYKSRKKDAVKKLEDTEQNLLRIHDLVSELEDQIEPLREQSEKAKQYKELKLQLKTNEISLYVYQIEQVYRSWTEAGEKLAELQRSQEELSVVIHQHDALLEKHRWESKRLEDELEKLHESLLQISGEYEKCEGLGEVLKERKKYLEQNKRQLEHTAQSQTARVEDKEREIHTYREKSRLVGNELERLRQLIREEEERLIGIAGGTNSTPEDQLKAELLDKLNQIAQTRNDIKYIEQQVESLFRRMERAESEHAKWSAQNKELLTKKENASIELNQVVAEINNIREQYMAQSEALTSHRALSEEAQLTIRRWEQKIDALVSRRDTMREMQSDFDGFQLGVKEVLKARDRSDGMRGIHGAVAELVKVPAELETAVETSLGGALQHIVVESEADGRAAIAYLKKRQNGRATFLPLDVIKGRFISESDIRSIREASGYVGVAAQLIQYSAKYAQVVSSLLGNVVIAETLEQANKIAAKCQYRYRVVTLEGDVVNAGGSMTGGSLQKKGVGLLGRQRQIEELDKDIEHSQQHLSQLTNKADSIRNELNETTKQLEHLRQQGETKRIEEQQMIADLRRIDDESRNIEAQISLYAQDREALIREITDNEERKNSQLQALQPLMDDEARLQDAIVQAESERKAKETAKEFSQSQLTELKVKAAAVSQEQQSSEESLDRLQSELKSGQAERAGTQQELVRLAQELQDNETESIKQTEDLNSHEIKKQQCAERIDFTRAERAEWMAQLEQEENKTKLQRTELKQVEERLRQTEVRVNRLDVELENLLKKLAEEYELSYELAKERYPVPEDILGTQNNVREFKRRIAMLGEVNIGAIDEYNRIYERYHFLSGQKNDLTEAKAILYQVIKEMDEEMSRRFESTFQLIRAQFSIVFAKLFGGGRADLVLSEPDQVLDSGIDIVAQPPGKKLQNLQLLSGGERALTAIALLFAILRVKPVPFCVLDEVEAALDEANVTRFAEYLREFSLQTQFIVVTHRKGTMEGADVLYGVTMEEGGVSKLVSVRLEDGDAAVSA